MSKTAIATLKKAESIMATAGVNVDLVPFLNDGKARKAMDGKKLWRNADKLALLIVDSAANAFQGECSETLSNGDNFFKTMTQAVEAYISSNLDCWSQVELEDCSSFFKVDHLARLADMVKANMAFEQREAAHAEALAFNAEIDEVKADEQKDEWANQHDSRKTIAQMIQSDHAEALAMNAAFDEERLNREYHNTMTGIEEMNKAKAKQQQNPDHLPKDQMVDVVRAALRTMPSSQEQIDNVANLTQQELRKLIILMLGKEARVTAHLTKSKSCGYGFLTFGYNGQLPPGTYHKLVVSNMKNAREVANRYGAMMWNF